MNHRVREDESTKKYNELKIISLNEQLHRN